MNGFTSLIVGFGFYAGILIIGTFLFLGTIHLRDTRRERRSTSFHETAHALMAMATGLGFEKTIMEKSILSHGSTYLATVPYHNEPASILHSEDDKTRHMMLVMVAGYVAEMVLIGAEHIPQRLSSIETSDMHRLDVLLNQHPHLYADSTKEHYVDGIIEQAKDILARNSQLHQLMSVELHKNSSLTEPMALLIASKARLNLKKVPSSAQLAFQA